MALDTIDIHSNNNPRKQKSLFHVKEEFKDGFVEIVIWNVPKSVSPSEHLFKYRLVYIINGLRIIGYDNERGKGDNKHILQEQLAYKFIDPAQLIEDFYTDIEEI